MPTPSFASLFGPSYRALMIAALGATFLGSLDALMVVTALPSAAQDIGGVDLIALAVGAVMVTIVMTLPIAGGIIDRRGAAPSFAVACTLFTVANIIGGLAPNMPVLAVSRAVLGLGAGFMFAVPVGLFALYIPDALRPRAFGLNAAMWGVSALIGPALGALLTGSVGWRWVFWINLPLIAVVAVAARLAFAQHPARAPQETRPLNILGPVLLGLAVLTLLVPNQLFALLFVVPTALFVIQERRTAAPVFTHRRRSLAANVAAFAGGAAFMGAETYLPLQLQVGYGHSVWVVGLALVLATLGWTTGSMTAARIGADASDQVLVGTVLVAVATLVMAIPAPVVVPILAYAFAGLGMGIVSPALFAVVLEDGEQGREGQTTSSIPLSRQVGSGTGIAIAGAVFAASLSHAALRASEHSGAHVPSVVPAARISYFAAGLLGLVGVVACRWLRRGSVQEAVTAAPDRAAA